MNVPPELASVLGALGTAAVFLIRRGARWVGYRYLRSRVQKAAREPGGPEFGTPGWLYGEILRERGARHALQREVSANAQRLARLEGRSDSGEQQRVSFAPIGGGQGENDTDQDPSPAWLDEEPRTPVEPSIARQRARRSRP